MSILKVAQTSSLSSLLDGYDRYEIATSPNKAKEFWNKIPDAELTPLLAHLVMDKNFEFSRPVWDILAPRIDWNYLKQIILKSDNASSILSLIELMPHDKMDEAIEDHYLDVSSNNRQYLPTLGLIAEYLFKNKYINQSKILSALLNNIYTRIGLSRDKCDEIADLIRSKLPRANPEILFQWMVASPPRIFSYPQLIVACHATSPNYLATLNKIAFDLAIENNNFHDYLYFLRTVGSYQVDFNLIVQHLMGIKNTDILTELAYSLSSSVPLNVIIPFILQNGSPYELQRISEINGVEFRPIQYRLQELKADDTLSESDICCHDDFDVNSFQDYAVKTKDFTVIIEVFDKLRNNRQERIGEFNIPTLQRFFETSKDNQLLEKFFAYAKNAKTFNFKAFKNKFNSWATDEYNELKPEDIKMYIERRTSHMSDDKKAEAIELYNDLLAKKDLYFILRNPLRDFLGNYFIDQYRIVKGKTYLQLFNESFRNSYTNFAKLIDVEKTKKKFTSEFIAILMNKGADSQGPEGFINRLIEKSNNLDQFLVYTQRIMTASEMMHNFSLGTGLARAVIANPKFNLDDKTSQELLESISWYEKNKLDIADDIKRATNINQQLINVDKLESDIKLLIGMEEAILAGQPINFTRGAPQYEAVKNLHISFAVLSDLSTIAEYVDDAKPKDPELMKLGLKLPNGFEFRVLKYLDPYAFRMGAETDCCQRIGGAGSAAAVDSFINPLAGVLILTYDDVLLAQSYFHYVPQEKGVILDNVEWNESHCHTLDIDSLELSKLYADYAAAIKDKYPDIAYVRCGKSFNKITNSMFETKSFENEEDPRHFEVSDPYSDFNELDHIDLLNPKESLRTVTVNVKNVKRASAFADQIKAGSKRMVAAARKIALSRAVAYLRH